jgi:hypothetical protein
MAAGFAMMPPQSHKNLKHSNPLNLQIARNETPISCGGNYSSAAIATNTKPFKR